MLKTINNKKFSLKVPNGKECFFESLSEIDLTIKKSTFHPGFNKTVDSHLLQLNCEINLPASFGFLLHWDN